MRNNRPSHDTLFLQQYTLNNFKEKIIQPMEPLANFGNSSQNSQQINNQTINYRLDHSHVSKSKSKYSQNQFTKHKKSHYQSEIQRVLTKQNKNLKQHNGFLVNQIKTLYERQKKIKKNQKKYQRTILSLQSINLNLSNQLNTIVTIIMQQIQRIQLILLKDHSHSRNNSHSFPQQQTPQSTIPHHTHFHFKQVQHKQPQNNISTSFFAYSEPSMDQSNKFHQSEQLRISNKLLEIKQKIHYFMNSNYMDKLGYQAQQNHQEQLRGKKYSYNNKEKIQNVKLPSKYQILTTNTNSQYVNELPLEIIKVRKDQRYKMQN